MSKQRTRENIESLESLIADLQSELEEARATLAEIDSHRPKPGEVWLDTRANKLLVLRASEDYGVDCIYIKSGLGFYQLGMKDFLRRFTHTDEFYEKSDVDVWKKWREENGLMGETE